MIDRIFKVATMRYIICRTSIPDRHHFPSCDHGNLILTPFFASSSIPNLLLGEQTGSSHHFLKLMPQHERRYIRVHKPVFLFKLRQFRQPVAGHAKAQCPGAIALHMESRLVGT